MNGFPDQAASAAGRPPGGARPAVSIVLPFLGDEREAETALRALHRIERGPGDELIVADNCPDRAMSRVAARFEDVRAVIADRLQSPYHARNVAAALATNEWLLFTDADCVPEPAILDRYFEPTPDAGEGAVAGEVVGDPDQAALLARYQRDRGYLNQERYVRAQRPYAVTANLLVRAAAFRAVGGFTEDVMCDADTDFCWRLQDAGWRLGYRPAARVTHHYRETLRAFAGMILSYAAGRAWLNRRYPGAYPPEPRAWLDAPRAALSAVRWWAAGQRERGWFRGVDALVIVLDRVGTQRSNAASAVAGGVSDQPQAGAGNT